MKNNEIEILENGTQFFMPDVFTGNTILFEIGPDKSASIQIIGEAGSKPLSICLWPADLLLLKDFILKQTAFKITDATKLAQAHYKDRDIF
jgi:hypothetical protein